SNSTITIDYNGNVVPPLRAGDWILDATFYQRTANGPGAANAFFYRVVASEDVGLNVTRYEVQNTIRGYLASQPANQGGYTGTAVVIRGILDVYEKGPVRLP